MGLKKAINTDFGVDATYHKLVGINYDLTNGLIVAVLDSFVNYEVSKAKQLTENTGTSPSKPLAKVQVSVLNTSLSMDIPNISEVYKAIKSLPQWQDAEDVLELNTDQITALNEV